MIEPTRIGLMFSLNDVELNHKKAQAYTKMMDDPSRRWCFSCREKAWIAFVMFGLLVFGINLEQRTALRRMPMTDLGVFTCAAAAVQNGESLYAATDWHGWHYQYPPTLAILFRPFAQAIPALPQLEPGTPHTATNTPWAYMIDNAGSYSPYYGLHADNLRFFVTVLVWYFISVTLTIFASHLLASALEGSRWCRPPPVTGADRRCWWQRRVLPILICLTSIGTDFSRGQVDVIMLFSVAAALYLIGRNRDLLAGISLSIPAVIKLFPPLILLLPIWHRRWLLPIGSALGLMLTLLVIPVLALGTERTAAAYRDWAEVLVKPSLGKGQDTSRALELTNINATDNQSLLAFIHNWSYRNLPRYERPPQADKSARHAVHIIGGIMLLGFICISGVARPNSPRKLLIITGTLIGMAFVISPTVHNFYYLMLLPLLAGLVDGHLCRPRRQPGDWIVPAAISFFFAVDVFARFPWVGGALRDLGMPLISMISLMLVGIIALRRENATTLAIQPPPTDHQGESTA